MSTECMRMQYCIKISPELPVCVNCRYFVRHYLRDGRPLECGHCVHPRIKNRKTYDYCSNFEQEENGKEVS
jgi:hypothetical protein